MKTTTGIGATGLAMIVLLSVLPALAGPWESCPGCPDTDGDGLVDPFDNCLYVANPKQLDCDFDGCGNACDGDLNQDGGTGITDFSYWALQFGWIGLCNPADFNEDGAVSITDFSIWATMFGSPPGPSGTTSGTTACP